MIRALFWRTVSDGWLLFVALCIAMVLFPWVFIWAQSKISIGAFSDFLTNALPQNWQRLGRADQPNCYAGRPRGIAVHPSAGASRPLSGRSPAEAMSSVAK